MRKEIFHKLTAEEERWTVLTSIEHKIDWVRALIEGSDASAGPWRGFDELGLPRERIEAALDEIEAQVAVLKQTAKSPPVKGAKT
jgi:hypothetical protein